MKKYLPRKVNALRSGVRSDRSDPGNGQVFAKTRPGEPPGSTRTLLTAEFLHRLVEFVQRSESYFASTLGESPVFYTRTLAATANPFPKHTHSANALPSTLRLGSDWLSANPRRTLSCPFSAKLRMAQPATCLDSVVRPLRSITMQMIASPVKVGLQLSANLYILLVKGLWLGECWRETLHLLDR